MNDGTGRFDRRRFVGGAAWLGLTAAGLALLNGCQTSQPAQISLDAPPETTRLRIGRTLSVCTAPYIVAHDLLKSEGFSDLEYPYTYADNLPTYSKALGLGA